MKRLVQPALFGIVLGLWLQAEGLGMADGLWWVIFVGAAIVNSVALLLRDEWVRDHR